VEIIGARAPQVASGLAREVAAAIGRLRELDLVKRPGVAETIEWARALAFLGASALEPDGAQVTLGTVVKDHDDLVRVRKTLASLLRDG
jgi:hypothetical protein